MGELLRSAAFDRRWLVAILIVASITPSAWTPSAEAQPVEDPTVLAPPPREGDVVIWYRVQQGDTLERITENLLGTHRLWEENHRLNPFLSNPNRLRIGQWIRVIESRPNAERFAEVRDLSGEVQALLFPSNTKEAQLGDRLEERDGVQTAQSSSTQLLFDDESSLEIGESSLVFLEVVDETLTGIRREMIEIRRGQAEVSTRSRGPRQNREIEIRIGGAKARPEVGPDGRAQTRARRAEGGGAQVMVYNGASVVEAAGESVDVPEGMGSSVPETGPPSPPEKLLSAPRLEAPGSGAVLPYANPDFQWSAVDGAQSYTLELCADPSCVQLLLRRAGLETPRWDSAEALPQGAAHWRVTAVSDSGLDGYPAKARSLTIDSPDVDLEAPVVVARVVGAGRVLPAEGASKSALLGPGGGLALAARDDVSKVKEIRYRWNQGSWATLPAPWDAQVLRPQASAAGGEAQSLELQAVDHRGRISEPVMLELQLDTQAPPAPTPRWTLSES